MHCMIVEDDEDDKDITQTFVSELGFSFPLTYVSNGDKLFTQLEAGIIPSLVLINYNMGPDNGLALLKRLKSDNRYSSIPVVILCGIRDPKLVQESYRWGASSFIQKPETMEATRKKIATFFNYWTEVAETMEPSLIKHP